MADLRWGAATHSGLVRDANEDAYVAEALVFGVADGMGGHRAGEVVSALASNTLRERLMAGASNVDVVVAAVLEANAAIFQAAHANAAQEGMGTTVTALVVIAPTDTEPEHLALVNVGDSRTYLHRNGELTRATVDHSYVQELVATGHITETEARTHPRRNIVTRALGIEPTVRVDAWVLPLVRGDRFILCSDGLVDEVPDHEIADVAGGIADPQRAADELVAMANRHGGRDNVTVIVVDVVDGIDPQPQLAAEAAAEAADADAAAADAEAAEGADAAARAHVPDETLMISATGVARSATSDVPAENDTTVAGEDDTTEIEPASVEATPVRPARRRLTLRLFLLLIGIAAIVTLAITLIAVVVTNDDPPAPSTTAPTTVATTSPATTPATTVSPSTTADTDVTTTRPPVTSTLPTTTTPSATAAPTTSEPTAAP